MRQHRLTEESLISPIYRAQMSCNGSDPHRSGCSYAGSHGGSEEGFEMVCMEEVRGHQRVYLRRASDAALASDSGEGWLVIDDHVRDDQLSSHHRL